MSSAPPTGTARVVVDVTACKGKLLLQVPPSSPPPLPTGALVASERHTETQAARQGTNKMASAAPDSDDEGSDHLYSEEVQLTLKEFVTTYTLPQTVAITEGSYMSHSALLARGDVLVLNGLVPPQVNLSFYDTATRVQHEVMVSTELPTKFIVLPPKEAGDNDSECPSLSKHRPLSVVSYPTISDLLMDCPTCFEANTSYDDPYLPGFSIKPGDKFRFVKTIVDSKDQTGIRLQCRTEGGEIINLSSSCRGNFTVVKDETAYTLQELIRLAKVPRRIKLAPENGDLIDFGDSSRDLDDEITGIPGMPSTFTGVICMSKPEEAIDVSPLDNPDTNWKIPVSANLHVRLHRSSSDYEEPVRKKIQPQSISSFAAQYEYQLPIHAGLLRYHGLPSKLADCLGIYKDIIAHAVMHSKKLFVKDAKKNNYFSIRESENVHFVETPRMFSSVLELLSLPNGSNVQILADIAADCPQPFILKYGDIICVKKYETESWKLKKGEFFKIRNIKSSEFWKSKLSSTGEMTVLKCIRLGPDGGKLDKLKLPLDLEVSMVQKTDPADLKVIDIADIFSGKENIPSGNVSVVEGKGGSYSCLPTEFQILQVLTEKEILISPLDSASTISPLVETGVLIPLRYNIMVGFKRKLEFPDGYFVMPPAHKILCENVEEITESEYEELERAKKLATEYEDVGISGKNQTSCKGGTGVDSIGSHSGASSDGSLPRTISTGSLEQRKRAVDQVKRLSKALNPKNWKFSRAAASESEVTLPPPGYTASGILTLALQPPQAAANVYQGDVGDCPSLKSPKIKKQDSETAKKGAKLWEHTDDSDDPYEDVNIAHPPVQMTKSLQAGQSGSSMSQSAGQLKMSLSASAENVSLTQRDKEYAKPMPKLKSPAQPSHKKVTECLTEKMSYRDDTSGISAELVALDSLKKSPKPRRPRRKIDAIGDNCSEDGNSFDATGLEERVSEVNASKTDFRNVIEAETCEKQENSDTVNNYRPPKPAPPPKPVIALDPRVPLKPAVVFDRILLPNQVVTANHNVPPKLPVTHSNNIPPKPASASNPVVPNKSESDSPVSANSGKRPVAPPRTKGIKSDATECMPLSEGQGARPKVLPREKKK